MTAPRDIDRLIGAFLDEGRDELSDRRYDAVRAHIERTRQRVVLGPWTEEQLSRYAGFALAAAAIVLVAVVAVQFLPAGGGIGGPPTPTPSPTPTPVALPSEGPLVGGTTYFIDDPAISPVRMTVTVPGGWQTISGFVYKARTSTFDETTTMLSHWFVRSVYRDPCHWTSSLIEPPIGPTVDDLANALAAQVGRSASSPTDATIDGFSGMKVDLSVPADFDRAACDDGEFKTWSTGPFPGDYGGFVYGPGQRDSVYVVDVSGERVVIHTLYLPGTPEVDRAELQAIFESIRLEP